MRVVAVIVVFVLLYAGVVTLYALSGNVASLNAREPEPEDGGVTVVFSVEGVDAVHQRVDMSVQIDPSESLLSGDSITLKQDVHVIVSPIEGSQALTFGTQATASTKPVTLITEGEVANWPFDAYRAEQMIVLAYVMDGDKARPIPTNIWFAGDVPGWSVDASQKGKAPKELPSTLLQAAASSPLIDIVATRSVSTVAFAVVLLALLIVMPCLVLFVAITAYRGRRKLEPSFMGWMGAMLFATIPLRTFLPGSPPIGSWIDYTVVLWVVVGLIVGLAIYVAAWARWSHPGP